MNQWNKTHVCFPCFFPANNNFLCQLTNQTIGGRSIWQTFLFFFLKFHGLFPSQATNVPLDGHSSFSFLPTSKPRWCELLTCARWAPYWWLYMEIYSKPLMAENEWDSLGLLHPNKWSYFTSFETWFLGPTRPAANLCVLFVLLLMVQKSCTTWDVERHVYILGSTTNLTLGRISELSTLVLCPPSLQNPYLQILHQNCVNLKPIPSMYGIFTYTNLPYKSTIHV